MENSKLKNIVILKDLPSNIVDEAIIVLKTTKKAKRLQKIEKKQNESGRKNKKYNKKYILDEAETIVNDYINKVENRKEKLTVRDKVRYNKLKKYSILISLFSILEMVALIFKWFKEINLENKF